MVPEKDLAPLVVTYSRVATTLMVTTNSVMILVCITLLAGTYFIDPNGGSNEDAMEVKCYKIDGVEWTCIEPKEKIFVRQIMINYTTKSFLIYCTDI